MSYSEDSNEEPILSSDDEVDQQPCRKLPRFKYTTFDDDGDAFDQRGLPRSKEEAIYGAFLDDSDDNDTRRNRKRKYGTATKSSTPMFVKGETVENVETDPLPKKKQSVKDPPKEPETPREPTPEELEAQRKQEEANQHFLALLNKGRGRKASKRTLDTTTTATDESYAAGPVGLGFSQADQASQGGGLGFQPQKTNDGSAAAVQPAPGIGMAFGKPFQEQLEPPKKRDPNIGTWEKHTKGIGMKLLSKMGYKGSGGLGSHKREAAKKKGISRPVEVKVRPANLGLGFGHFKEATKLKANQRIEAEVRGVELPKETTAKTPSQSSGTGINAVPSALPSVKDLMAEQSWKRGSPKSTKKRQKRNFIPYTELLEKQKQAPVIDMRGPTAKAGATTEAEVPLAEELLHNCSLLLNTYENKIHSSAHFAKSTKQKLESLQSDVASMEERRRECDGRTTKLQHVLKILDQIEALTDRCDDMSTERVNQVQSLVQELGSTFTAEERDSLKFSEVIVPSLLGNVVQAKIGNWNPLSDDANGTEELIRSVLSVSSSSAAANTDQEQLATRVSMFAKHLLPRIKNALESSHWDPVMDVDSALNLYEIVYEIASEVSPKSDSADTVEQSDDQIFPSMNMEKELTLMDLVKEEIIDSTVYPKLTRSLNQWKPSLDREEKIADRPDLWILPWIPHLDNRALMPSLVSDCKRKIRNSISFLQKSTLDDERFFHAAIDTLRPWRGVFKKESIHGIMSNSVTPRLARYLSKLEISQHFAAQKWEVVDSAFDMNSLGLLSDQEFIGLIEGELLPRWASMVHEWLLASPPNIAVVVDNYVGWRRRLLGMDSLSCRILQEDSTLCRIYYAVLRMIQAVSESHMDVLDDLRPQLTNYRVVVARRAAEEKRAAADDLMRIEHADDGALEARVRLHRNGNTPTFRDVVEEFARERDVLFQPRMGNNALKDGKQVFLFGKVPVYLDSNVVFALQGSEWRPIALDTLAATAEAATA